MTTGALIFAFNNEEIDYVSMAAWSADNIHRHLGIPVCVVTDSDTADTRFDRIIQIKRSQTDQKRHFLDLDSRVTWYNQDRVDAYSISPWDQTLVLDADYVVASDQLVRVLKAPQPFLCHRLAWDITTGERLDNLNYFGRNRMPMWWATVMMFRKSTTVQYIFDSMRMIRDNWNHYRDLYAIGRSKYRNDFALSIALGIISGHTLKVDEIHYGLATVLPEHSIKQLDTDHYRISYKKQDRDRHITVTGMDFHAMGKGHLGDIIASQS